MYHAEEIECWWHYKLNRCGLLERLCSLQRESAVVILTTRDNRGVLLARDVVEREDAQRDRCEYDSQGTIVDP